MLAEIEIAFIQPASQEQILRRIGYKSNYGTSQSYNRKCEGTLLIIKTAQNYNLMHIQSRKAIYGSALF